MTTASTIPVHCSHTELADVVKLIPNPRNPNKHPDKQIALLAKIIRHQGWRSPVVISNRSGFVVKGHGRLEAAKLLQVEHVPIDRQDYATEADEWADLIADNRIAELAETDDKELSALLGEIADKIDLELTGFDAEGLSEIKFNEPDATVDAEPQIDKAEELRAKWGVEPGQLWELGEHRMMCGDSTKTNFGDECSTLLFDPPWDLMADTKKRDYILAFCDAQRLRDTVNIFGPPDWLFAWDCVSSWFVPNRPLKRIKMCAFYGNIENYNADGSHYGNSGEQREVFNSRGSYTFTPDPRGKHLSDLFCQPITKLHSESEHSHSKPLDWVRMLIANCTSGKVFDPYAGSGTTIIACEQLGRKCRAIEISPAYVAVAIQRWADATGKEPKIVQ